jgi:hypothetical protein
MFKLKHKLKFRVKTGQEEKFPKTPSFSIPKGKYSEE